MKQLFFIGVFFVYFFTAQAQQEYFVDSILKSNNTVARKITILDQSFKTKKSLKFQNLKKEYHNYAYWLYDQKEVNKAIGFELKAIQKAFSTPQIDTAFLIRSYYDLGYYLYKIKRYKATIEVNKRIYQLSKDSPLTAKAYNRIALSYIKLRDYYNAITYFEVAVSLEKKPRNLRSLYQNLAIYLPKLDTQKSFELAQMYAQRADSISEIIPTKLTTRFNIKTIYADLYNTDKTLNTEKANRLYKEALDIANKSKDSMLIRDAYISLGNAYNQIDHKLSDAYLKKALTLSKPADSIRLYHINIDIGYNLGLQNKYSESINSYVKGLSYLVHTDFKNSPKLNTDHLDPNTKSKLATSFSQIAEIYLQSYEATNEKELLKNSLHYFKLSDILIDELRSESTAFNSRLFWREISSQLYSNAIRACYLNDDKELAFNFMEKNKAILLLEDVLKQTEKRLELIEDVDILKKLELEFLDDDGFVKTDIKTAETKENPIKPIITDEAEINNVTANLISFNTISAAQEYLNENSLLIEYNLSKDDGYGIYSNNTKGYVLIVSKKQSWLFEIENLEALEKLTREHLTFCKKPFQTQDDIENFTKVAHTIFNSIFPSKEIRATIKQKNLIVVPDSFLSFLPFETLVTETKTQKYLIQDSTISYQYSFSFLQNIKEKSEEATPFIAFAPSTFNNLDLTTLSFGKEEIRPLKKHYNGTVFYDQNATKEQYISAEKNNAILHFTTHANAQDSISPWIAFTDKKITLEELYNNPNNASLVFLSGCNTTLGKQEEGEGVMSLARGFFYGGARSVISSLWNVDDRATATISQDFYTLLAQGNTKSKALHTAKAKYLNTHTFSEKSPYYWGSLIILGQDDTLKPAPNNWPHYIVILLIIGIVFLIYLKKTKK